MAEIDSRYKNHSDVKFLTGPRNILLLCHQNFLYKRINSRFPKSSWKCYTGAGCLASVYTNNGILVKSVSPSVHGHLPPIDEITTIETKTRIRKRVESEFNLSPRQIHMEEQTKLVLNKDNDAHLRLKSFSSCRSSLYKYRQAIFPKAPKSRGQIEISDQWKLTLDSSENFLLVDDGSEDRILIFGTNGNLRILCNAHYVVSDGTFTIQPSIFSQLYVFHAPYLGQVLPLLFCLLPDKKYNTYCRLLQLIRNAAQNIGINFNPRKIHIDYELSMIKAVNHVFSETVVQGCLFHYCQCLWRKVQDLGLVVAYKEHGHIRRWIRRLSALPFLPLNQIDDGFLAVHESAPDPNDYISYEQIEKFHDYMVNTWVDDNDALFDRRLWNQNENDGPRTTNNAEGWNHKLNQQAKTRLTFFQFVHFLQKLQVDLDSTKFNLISESPRSQAARSKVVDITIQTAKQNFATADINVLHYLDSISIALKLD